MAENKLNVFTLFSGYDSQCMALDRLGIAYECVGWSEIDPYAIKAHNALYPQWEKNFYGDVTKINWEDPNIPRIDLLTFSFPCQDISNAGLQRGFKEGSGTRSGLLWECVKPITIKRPKWLVMENVKALASKKFLPEFERWIEFLDEAGYNTTWKCLNACDYGIPQNRERIIAVSELRYQFPKGWKLKECTQDRLQPEEEVDDSYRIREEQLQKFVFDERSLKEYERIQGDTSR